jgi:hypothetical protein
MERTDWLDEGFDAAQARFLMATSITHHRFGSAMWGDAEVRKLLAELAEIDATAGDGSAAPSGVTPERSDRADLVNHPDDGGWNERRWKKGSHHDRGG